ncbi:MAG: lyase family protein, partial [Betaproteobacteria bacterium]
MAATLIDSTIFQGIFSSDEMRHVWSDENRTQKYLDVESALAKVQGRLGLIPQQAADEIVSHCHLDQIDMGKLRQQTERIGYPILGVVSQLNALCRDKLGEYCHWGATTQDITDTATVLQIREGLDLVERELAAISSAIAKLARAHRDTPMIGRSNLQQAIPVTFGYKMAGLLSSIERHRERLAQLRPRGLDPVGVLERQQDTPCLVVVAQRCPGGGPGGGMGAAIRADAEHAALRRRPEWPPAMRAARLGHERGASEAVGAELAR